MQGKSVLHPDYEPDVTGYKDDSSSTERPNERGGGTQPATRGAEPMTNSHRVSIRFRRWFVTPTENLLPSSAVKRHQTVQA